MQNIRKASIVSLCFLICFCWVPRISTASTTLGESVFPAEEGDELIWETTNATESWYIDVEYIRFTVSSIFNSTYLGENYLFMNYTLEYYHRFAWVPQYINSFYMAYNRTLHFLNWSSEAFLNGNAFLYPTPINFSLIGESIEGGGYFNTSLVGNKLTLDYGNNTRIEHTINSSGLSTVIEKITNGTTIYKWELNTDEVIVRIPFGNEFLIFTTAGIITLVSVSLRKIKKSKNY